jgi:hypothetical protein
MHRLRNTNLLWTSLLALIVGFALMSASPSPSMANTQVIADADPGDIPAGGGLPVPGNGVGDPDEPTTRAKGAPGRGGGRLGTSPVGVGDARGMESVWMWRLQTMLQIVLRYRPLP